MLDERTIPMLQPYLSLTRKTLGLSLFLPIIVTLCSRGYDKEISDTSFGVMILIACGIAFYFWNAVCRLLASSGPALQDISEGQIRFIDELPEKWVAWSIVASACVSLSTQLAIIRWQGTEWEIFALYKNFGMLSCFAGLGLGYALAKRDSIPLVLTIPLLAVQALLLVAMRHGMAEWQISSLMTIPVAEQLTIGFNSSTATHHMVAVYAFLTTMMLLTATAFIPVGQVCGRFLERTTPLKGYGLNLLGSILGTLLMMLLSTIWTPPIIWLVPCFTILILLQMFDRKVVVIGMLAALATISVLGWPVSFCYERIYSPYQLLERGLGDHGLTMIKAAGHYYQRIHDLSESAVAAYPNRKAIRDYYELPYRLHPGAKNVAVVGAGMGNDVAAALRCNVAYVDAIEIDPAIMELGEHYHPEYPYLDKRVNMIVDDARTFLRGTTNSYDLVVYGLLDSHSLLSHASSVRLDSFVYTVEGIRDAKNRLAEDGIVCLSFCILSQEIGRKIYLMMKEAFDGNPPICISTNYDGSVTFLQSRKGNLSPDPAALAKTGFTNVTQKYADPNLLADVSTDDWPFFYMPHRIYPVTYVGMMALILLVSVLLFWNFVGQMPKLSNAAYFFMGAGFMLVETKAITELGLMFGNTWQIIGIVITAVMIMAYLANLAVSMTGIRRTSVSLVCLILSLGIGLAVAKSGGMPATAAGQFLAVVVLTIPMFFSGIAFSSLLASSQDISNALAMNLLGAMCGGLLEYNSMYFGFQFLYWMAMALYGLALLRTITSTSNS
ncbi:MAG: spermidine synthase-like protein [uncultured bacterium]|nr:MAG: spermidine synthase-like protein [uncultured bacterium]